VLEKGKKTIEEVSKESGIDKQACTGILAIMNENSEVIEKRKGVFILT
jgi:predicted transcriptional regulator